MADSFRRIRKLRIKLALPSVVLPIGLACGLLLSEDGSPQVAAPAPGPANVATIGSQGGVLQHEGVRVEVPARAVSIPTRFAIQPGTPIKANTLHACGAPVQLLPSGVSFDCDPHRNDCAESGVNG